MIIRRNSNKYNFIGNTKSGITFRWGGNFNEDPVFAPWPELADISISNHCSNNCDFCYRNSGLNYDFMSTDKYEFILKSLTSKRWGNVFQIALGGGEPLEHPDFLKIIELTCDYNVVPNFTTNGKLLNKNILRLLENRVGAIAISISDINQINDGLISLIASSKIKINAHYLLSEKNIKQGVSILEGKYNKEISMFNGIIFLTYKPMGRARPEHKIVMNEDMVKFFQAINHPKCPTRIGFDACFVPMLLHFTNIDVKFIDACECGFFSIYIDEMLNVKPCSFEYRNTWSFNLQEYTFEEIWNEKLSRYRLEQKNECNRDCLNRSHCRGKCPTHDITLCYSQSDEKPFLN